AVDPEHLGHVRAEHGRADADEQRDEDADALPPGQHQSTEHADHRTDQHRGDDVMHLHVGAPLAVRKRLLSAVPQGTRRGRGQNRATLGRTVSAPTPARLTRMELSDEELPGFIDRLGLPGLVDIHVHFMPERVLDKVWAYFDRVRGVPWPVRYR